MKKIVEDLDGFIQSNIPLIQTFEITKNRKEAIRLMAMNMIADSFKTIVCSDHSDIRLQDAIKSGLNWLDNSGELYDTEEEEEICEQIMEIMDIVGLESSGGHLNVWRYGFDPNMGF
jgi:hypothetical protein